MRQQGTTAPGRAAAWPCDGGEDHDQQRPQRHRQRVGQHHAPTGEHAASTPTGRSSSIGIATTLLANTGAASTPRAAPSLEQPAGLGEHDVVHEVGRLLTTSGTNQVTSEAEVSTQPVPASASRARSASGARRGAACHQARTARHHRSQRCGLAALERATDGVQPGGQHRRHQKEAAEAPASSRSVRARR